MFLPPPRLSAWSFGLLLLLLLVRANADVVHAHGLLWQVQRGDSPPSWVFGTMHTDDERVTRLPEPVARAFDDADIYLFEIDFAEVGTGAGMARMFFTDGRNLRNKLDKATWHRARDAAADRGLPEPSVALLKPWALAIILSLPETDATRILDFSLYRRAQEKSGTIRGLETTDEQLAIFDELPLDHQLEFLENVLSHLEAGTIAPIHEELIELYVERDLAGMVRIAEDHPALPGADANESLMRRLVDERNRIMVTRMQSSLREGNAFIAIGALHLPGRHGILQLLAAQGFEVTRTY